MNHLPNGTIAVGAPGSIMRRNAELEDEARAHTCTLERCPAGGKYFVTAVDGPSWWPMSGPYQTHAAALLVVDQARKIASDHDGRAWFMAWGTARLPDDYSKVGRLNEAGLLEVSK